MYSDSTTRRPRHAGPPELLYSPDYVPRILLYANELGNRTAPFLSLNPAFPTWGEAIQALNAAYRNNVWWFGKWHLSICHNAEPLKPYGFNTGKYPGGAAGNPSPDGVPNEGVNGGRYKNIALASDAEIASDFIAWLQGQAPNPKPRVHGAPL